MAVFALCFLLMALAAAGLGVGALRGRPLPGGSCREGYLAAHLLPRCEGCPSRRAAAGRNAPG